jgi:DNA polymerase I-like protein with 3'-5' exonuclease and polymerase domains
MREKLAILDLETYAIKARPEYPPKPVGLAALVDGEKTYEPCRTENDRRFCARRIRGWIRAGYVPVFHNASFDLDVLETHMGITWPAYHHDTLLLAYLFEPRASTFRLKDLAEKLLGEKPTERDALRDWIIEHVKGATAKTWGAYISEAPFELVRPYAIGDVVRTHGLVKLFLSQLSKDKQICL